MIKQYQMTPRNMRQIMTNRAISTLLCWTCGVEITMGQKVVSSQSKGSGGKNIRHLACARRIRVV